MEKIAILTFQNALNYGALLQMYALQQKIIALGINAVVLDYDNGIFYEKYILNESVLKCRNIRRKVKLIAKWILKPYVMLRYKRKQNKLLDFMNKKIIYSEYCDKNSISEVCKQYNRILVGSDQVWNFRWTNFDATYLLDFLNDNEKKYAYAASFGTNRFDEKAVTLYAEYLPKFRNILIREKTGQTFMKDNLGLNSTVVLDPTLLLDKSFWTIFCQDAKMNYKIKRKYVLIYLIGEHTHILNLAKQYAVEHDMDIVTLSVIKLNIPAISVEDAGVEEFVNYIKNASCIFTTSFHGLVFSINLNTNFYYELSHVTGNNNSRIVDIAQEIGVSDREISENKLTNTTIDWDSINQKLDFLRNQSIKNLCKTLDIIEE